MNGNKPIKLIECPRDAMQGWKVNIPTATKIEYINQLLRVGFDTIDFGSFVSPKAIPQMADTKEVIEQLDAITNKTKLLAIIANARGAKDASAYKKIDQLGYPFSVSPTFQMRNANSTIDESFVRVKEINTICGDSNKELVIYISMAFGNPYGDFLNEEIILKWIEKLVTAGITIISLADTVGIASASQVSALVKKVIATFPQIETGVHLHAKADGWKHKIEAAYNEGCRRFDGSLNGIGGCPMAEDELVGNMNMQNMINFFKENKELLTLDLTALASAINMANNVFN
ncbi:MAG: hydroxymethylglutaryl-CoA lyase [Ginsengibacter sp.]